MSWAWPAACDLLAYWLFRLEVWRDERRWVRPRWDPRPWGGYYVPPRKP